MAEARKPIPRAAIVARAQAVAERLGRRQITRDEFVRASGIARKAISRHFARFWDLLREAGLDADPPNRPVDDDTLQKALRDGCTAVNGVIGQLRFQQLSKHHANTVKKRWGGWDKALAALRDWLLRHELGFVLEGLSTGFPDAEVKRRDGKGWRRARVEFEHQSRNFRLHGHDPAGCDLIICWEHNWRGCPIEVLELKSAVEKLKGLHA